MLLRYPKEINNNLINIITTKDTYLLNALAQSLSGMTIPDQTNGKNSRHMAKKQ